jgi:hypothetical protein
MYLCPPVTGWPSYTLRYRVLIFVTLYDSQGCGVVEAECTGAVFLTFLYVYSISLDTLIAIRSDNTIAIKLGLTVLVRIYFKMITNLVWGTMFPRSDTGVVVSVLASMPCSRYVVADRRLQVFEFALACEVCEPLEPLEVCAWVELYDVMPVPFWYYNLVFVWYAKLKCQLKLNELCR